MTGDQIISVFALTVTMIACLVTVLAWLANRRSAAAAERSASSSERSERSSVRSAEAAERSAYDSARMTAIQIDQRHEELQPHVPPALETFTVSDPNRAGLHMVKAILVLEPGEGPPRDYRLDVVGRTLHSTTPISGPPTVRPGQRVELYLGSVRAEERLSIVELSLRFRPNTAGSGEPKLTTWSCPCGLPDLESGHWLSVVGIDFDPVPAIDVEADDGYSF
ncbi:hypothetical protein [Nocardiopsis sp. YSL2]|uniref:hypothetical protein n=1 Tax=Nocardiopsis sp. YSL2 TaxID=2939492 RepID=UPI0026F43030|nr:hypothetical protein [Nocardiopsis sp. YSL2]